MRSDVSVDTGGGRPGEDEPQDQGAGLSRVMEALEDPGREPAGLGAGGMQGQDAMARDPGSSSSSFNSVGLHSHCTSGVTQQQGLLWKEQLLIQSRTLYPGTHQPHGFKKARGPLSLALAQTFTAAGPTTMQDVHETRRRFSEARDSTSSTTKKSYLEYLERNTPAREKIKKAAFPIEMVKKWFDGVDEDAVQGSIQGTILMFRGDRQWIQWTSDQYRYPKG